MNIEIFCMDGYDLYWVDEKEHGNLALHFEYFDDALWARQVWLNFLNGSESCPVVSIHPDPKFDYIVYE